MISRTMGVGVLWITALLLRRHKRAEETLRASEERYRTLAEAARDHIFVINARGDVEYVNEVAASQFACRPEKLVGQRMTALFPPEVGQQQQAHLRRVFEGGQPHYAETQCVFPHAEAWLGTWLTPLLDQAGRVRAVMGVARDITERKRAEEALAQSESKLRAFYESAPMLMGTVELTEDDSIIHIDDNPATARFFGLEPGHIHGKSAAEIGAPPAAIQLWVQHYRNSQRQGRPVRFEYLHESPCGPFWFSAIVSVIGPGPSGRIRFCYLAEDITERRQAEETLRKLSQAVEQSPASVLITDLQGNIQYVNRKFCQITGYTPDEVLGRNPRLLKSGNMSAETYRTLWQTISRGGQWDGEFLNRRKDGSLFWERAIISPIMDEQGQVTHFLGIKEDITAHKRAEEKMRQISGRLLQLQDEERRRIARELHDATAQEMAALSLNLTLLATRLHPLEPKSRELLDRSITLADHCATGVRTLAYLLHPPMLDELGLAGAVRDFVGGFANRSGIDVNLDLPSDLERLPKEIELALFRVLQESLANVHRHSGSKTAFVRLVSSVGKIQLEVQDAGRGIAVPAGLPTERGRINTLGVGISGMTERLRQLGGRLEVNTHAGGTLVRAIVPLTERAA